MDSYKKALTRRLEDRAKEKEAMAKIETEQRLVEPPSNSMAGKREQCLKVLGPDMYEKVYQYLKRARAARPDFHSLQNELLALINKDKSKINYAFLIDQIIDCELGTGPAYK